nr:FAD-dependent oxidoreductase [Quadrisphaera sp. RL12-1S]
MVGAGHSHLHLLRRAAVLRAAGYRVHLLAPRYFHYSGMASATAAGALPAGAGRIDVAALATSHGVQLHEGTMVGLDFQGRLAMTSEGAQLPYDVLCMAIGSVVALPGIDVDAGVLKVKPLTELSDLDARLRASPSAIDGSGASVTVLGGGSTGLELAAHLSVRPDVARVRLLQAGPTIGADLPDGARRRLAALLERRGVDVRTSCQVTRVSAAEVAYLDGSTSQHDVALVATGLAAPPLLNRLGLGDERGIPVRATLQHVHHEEVYATGDCAHFLPQPLPRIGVHGVRQGPVLLKSLLARRRGQPLPQYRPQHRALAVLDLGAGVGMAVRGRWWWYGRAPLHLKRRIDERWLRSYRQR